MWAVTAALSLLALLPAAAATWIPAAPPGREWTLTTDDPDLPTGIFETITYIDCGASEASALSLNVFAIATLANITGSNLRLLVHTTQDGVKASVKLTDASGRVTESTVSSALVEEQCPDISVDFPLDRALVYTLTIEVQEPSGYSTLGPQPHFNLVAVGIDQDSAVTSSSVASTAGTLPESQHLTTTSNTRAPSAVESHSSHVNVALIAGPVAGAMLLIILVLLFLLLRARRRSVQRKSWVSDVNGEGAYDAPSIDVSNIHTWSTYGGTSMAAGLGSPLPTGVSYARSSLAATSHPGLTDLSRTSFLAQTSVMSPLRHSEISTMTESTTCPFSCFTVAEESPNDPSHCNAGTSAKAGEDKYGAPPAYVPPDAPPATLQSKD